MSNQGKHTPFAYLVDAVLVVGFFLFMFGVLKGHVPSKDPTIVAIVGGASTACMTGVFWIAIQMFRVVYRGQKNR